LTGKWQEKKGPWRIISQRLFKLNPEGVPVSFEKELRGQEE
jgi:hypothetical protein